MEKLPVIFRVTKYNAATPVFPHDITAVFPTEVERNGNMECYAHVGQHSSCSPEWYSNNTRPAKPYEYADLLTELKGIYSSKFRYEDGSDVFELVVYQRRQRTYAK